MKGKKQGTLDIQRQNRWSVTIPVLKGTIDTMGRSD